MRRRHAGHVGRHAGPLGDGGIHTAGPNLTPKTFAPGPVLRAAASGGAAQNRASSTLSGYGKDPNLPYDEYASNGLDFVPYWWDPNQTGPSNGQGEVGKGVGWYANGAKRYVADDVAEEAVRLVRQGDVRLPLHDPTDADAGLRG